MNVLVFPCSTQIAVEQFLSLKYNKHFKLIGASHNENDIFFKNFIKIKNKIESKEFIEEIKRVINNFSIDILLSAHDETNFILKNNEEIGKLIPGSCVETINTTRFKSKTYKKLQEDENARPYLPEYSIVEDKFLKPDRGQGSKGVFRIEEPHVLCENLPGKEYTVDCFSDKSDLIYINCRHRKLIKNGISEITQNKNILKVNDIAKLINKNMKLNGAWFFQVKEDINGNIKLMEVSPRIAGGSNINRLNGVNLTSLSLYQHLGKEISIHNQNLVQEVERKNPKYNLDFETIFLDYDDTYEYVYNLIKNLHKKVIIITRSKKKIKTGYPVFYVSDEPKSKIINQLKQNKSIFIDDSHKERLDVINNSKIPAISPEEVECL